MPQQSLEIQQQIDQENREAAEWLGQHANEIPSAFTAPDPITRALQKAANSRSDKPGVHRQSQDFALELAASVDNEPISSDELITRLALEFSEAFESYFRHLVDNEKCRAIAENLIVDSKHVPPAQIKRWALGVREWLTQLDYSLEQKAAFLGKLRGEVSRLKKEEAWRQLTHPQLSTSGQKALEWLISGETWWQTAPIPEVEKYTWSLIQKLVVAKLLGGPEIIPNRAQELKQQTGGRRWDSLDIPVPRFHLPPIQGLQPTDPEYVRLVALSRQFRTPQAPAFEIREPKPVPQLTEAQRRDADIIRQLKADIAKQTPYKSARHQRAADLENCYLAVCDNPAVPAKLKNQFRIIVNETAKGSSVAEIAKRLKVSSRSVTNLIRQLRAFV